MRVLKKVNLAILLIFLAIPYTVNAEGIGQLDGVGGEDIKAGVVEVIEEPIVEVVQEVEPVKEVVQEEEQKIIQKDDAEKIEKAKGTANAVGGMFKRASIDEESIEDANKFIQPFAVILNKVMAGILGLVALLMTFITVLDLAYIAVPFLRDMLDGGKQGTGQLNARGSNYDGGFNDDGGMGMGGMGMVRPGGMGMGGMGRQGGMVQGQKAKHLGGGLSAVGRWVSDEALAAALESQGGPQGASSRNGSVKTMIGSYMKMRAYFLIMFGVCVVLFTSTIFTGLGVKLGTWLLGLLMGVSV